MSTSFAQTPTPAPPVKSPDIPAQRSLHRWSISFTLGSFSLFATFFVVTSVKRLLAHQWVNTGEAEFATASELYAAVEQHIGIGAIVLLLWSLGLFLSSYIGGRNFSNSKVMIFCFSAVCLFCWAVPHVWINAGFAGMTSILRALLIVPMVTWGVLLGKENSSVADNKKRLSKEIRRFAN